MSLALSVFLCLICGYSMAQHPKVTGDDFISIYSVKKTGNRLEISPEIPDSLGRPHKKGVISRVSTLAASGVGKTDAVTETKLDGLVWTPRVESVKGMDLSSESKLTESPEFNFESFKEHESVIAFANGYGVNLFGVLIKKGAIVLPNTSQSYTTEDGRKLFGRLISEKNEGGKRILEEIILR
jgi:hypothetical protein